MFTDKKQRQQRQRQLLGIFMNKRQRNNMFRRRHIRAPRARKALPALFLPRRPALAFRNLAVIALALMDTVIQIHIANTILMAEEFARN